jgi:hypothetical protein
MLSTGELYHDLGGDYFRKRDRERVTKRLVAQLEAVGHHVVLEELPQAVWPIPRPALWRQTPHAVRTTASPRYGAAMPASDVAKAL